VTRPRLTRAEARPSAPVFILARSFPCLMRTTSTSGMAPLAASAMLTVKGAFWGPWYPCAWIPRGPTSANVSSATRRAKASDSRAFDRFSLPGNSRPRASSDRPTLLNVAQVCVVAFCRNSIRPKQESHSIPTRFQSVGEKTAILGCARRLA
jgi:hypothetical protein